jgi:4-hydroxybenzoate polyprenyltransferase
MIKKLIRYAIYGILFSSLSLSVSILFNTINLEALVERPTLMVIAFWGIGIGSCAPVVLYEFKRLRFWMQTLIHYSIALTVFTGMIVILRNDSFDFSWFFFNIASFTASFAVIWTLSLIYDSHQAKKINEALRSRLESYQDHDDSDQE